MGVVGLGWAIHGAGLQRKIEQIQSQNPTSELASFLGGIRSFCRSKSEEEKVVQSILKLSMTR